MTHLDEGGFHDHDHVHVHHFLNNSDHLYQRHRVCSRYQSWKSVTNLFYLHWFVIVFDDFIKILKRLNFWNGSRLFRFIINKSPSTLTHKTSINECSSNDIDKNCICYCGSYLAFGIRIISFFTFYGIHIAPNTVFRHLYEKPETNCSLYVASKAHKHYFSKLHSLLCAKHPQVVSRDCNQKSCEGYDKKNVQGQLPRPYIVILAE